MQHQDMRLTSSFLFLLAALAFFLSASSLCSSACCCWRSRFRAARMGAWRYENMKMPHGRKEWRNANHQK